MRIARALAATLAGPSFVLAALAVGSFATRAAAEPLFDAFRATCVDTAADLAAVQAQTGANGWMPMPKTFLDQVSSGFGGSSFNPEEVQGWLKTDTNVFSVLIWARATLPVKAGAPAKLCAVASLPAQAGAEDDLKRWAAVPARDDLGLASNGQVYIFAVDQGAHRDLPQKITDTAVAEGFASGRLQIAMSQSDAQKTMLGLFVPAK